MKNCIYIFMFLFLTNLTNGQNPREVFKSHLKIIEKFLTMKNGESMSSTEFSPSIIFLENLTGIECDQSQGFVFVDEPSKRNLKDWKTWFRKNKSRLYWNVEEKKVMVNDGAPR